MIVTPYRGAGRPGAFAMERTMDAIAAYLGRDRAEVRQANFIQPSEMPYDHHLTFQDGRPLVYDSGDYPATLEKVKKLVGWDEFEAFRPRPARTDGGSGSAWPATWRAPGSAPTRARTCGSRPTARWWWPPG